MSATRDTQFDRYADSYRDLHRASVGASGEQPEYFSAYKVIYMSRKLGNSRLVDPARVLDFGCGVGGSIPHLRDHFPQSTVIGVDVSRDSLEIAKQAHPDSDFHWIEGARLDLPDAGIDVAMAACVYHHIPPAERLHWTSEIIRVLRPGGQFFLFEHNSLNPLTQRVVKNCAFDEDAILLPRRETLKLFEDAGFKEIAADYIVFFPRFLAFLRSLEFAMGWLPAGAQYVVHGRK